MIWHTIIKWQHNGPIGSTSMPQALPVLRMLTLITDIYLLAKPKEKASSWNPHSQVTYTIITYCILEKNNYNLFWISVQECSIFFAGKLHHFLGPIIIRYLLSCVSGLSTTQNMGHGPFPYLLLWNHFGIRIYKTMSFEGRTFWYFSSQTFQYVLIYKL